LSDYQLLDTTLTTAERTVLRRLAAQTAELAARPLEAAKRELWYRHNALEATRPLIFCDPENGWHEIITPADLECRGELAREWEFHLRKEIWWGAEMRDDRVIEPYFNVPHIHTTSGWGLEGTKVGGEDGGAFHWDSPIKSEANLERLHHPQIIVDYDATHELAGLAAGIFGDLLPVRIKTSWYWSVGMTVTLMELRGLDRVMLDMVENPSLVHRLMAFLRDGTAATLDYLEANDLLSLNNDGSYVGSGGFGWSRELPQPDFDGHVRTRDLWMLGESQETVGISPIMFAEFVLPYQLPLLERFGLVCYGCCEPLDKRWRYVQGIPRLRRVSVSPWSNLAKMAELLGDRYIYSMKPPPSDLALPSFDADRIRANLREAMRVTRNCRVEVIMKDNHTIGGDPQRVRRWVQIAREEAEDL
jgi:hypothetical protein